MAILKLFSSLLHQKNILSISGESGTGKTTLALYLIGHLLPNKEGSCIWVQVSEQFPKKRLISLFRDKKDILHYLENHIFVIPKKNTCKTYQEQTTILQQLSNNTSALPPELKFIVVDNISHHLRFALSCITSIPEKISLLDSFYEDTLLPLIMFCQRENVYLILLHEVSFNPNQNSQTMFFSTLYKRLDVIHVNLSHVFNQSHKKMTIYSGSHTWIFHYIIVPNGFFFKYDKE